MNVSRDMILKSSAENVSHSELELTIYVVLLRIVSNIKKYMGTVQDKMNNRINCIIKMIFEPL